MELEGNLFFGIEDQPAPLGDESKDLSPILFKLSMKRKIYSKDLGINLKTCKEEEFFKWFLACLLFGKPIQQKVAKRTYFEFKQAGILTPEKILKAGWDKLVEILDQGGYVRYDFSTATKLLEICKELKEKYDSLTKLFKVSKNITDLAKRLQEFKGIGPVTTRIFLRDLKPIYNKIKSRSL